MAVDPRPGPKPASGPLPLWGFGGSLVTESEPRPLSLWSRIGVGQWVPVEGKREESLKHESGSSHVLNRRLGSRPHRAGIQEAGMTIEAGICCIYCDDTLTETWWSRGVSFLLCWSPTVFYSEPGCPWGRGQSASKEACLGYKPFIWGLFCLCIHWFIHLSACLPAGPPICSSIQQMSISKAHFRRIRDQQGSKTQTLLSRS